MNDGAPVVRFTRDRRGYEHFYLVQPSRRGRGRQTILYWFRTPPGVKVGRVPFDAEMQRAIEAQHPEVAFDWSSLLDITIPPPVEVERWRERRRERRAQRAGDTRVGEERRGLIDRRAPDPAAERDETEGAASGSEAGVEPAAGSPPPTSNPAAASTGEPRRSGRRRRRRRGHRGEASVEQGPQAEPAGAEAAGEQSDAEGEAGD